MQKGDKKFDWSKTPERVGVGLGFRDTNIGSLTIPGSPIRGIMTSTALGGVLGNVGERAVNFFKPDEDEERRRQRRLKWTAFGAAGGLGLGALIGVPAMIANSRDKANEGQDKTASYNLTKVAPKWKNRDHLIAALKTHLQDTKTSLGTDTEKKEITDLSFITNAYRKSLVDKGLVDQRFAKFKQYASSPSLAEPSKQASWGFWNHPAQVNAGYMLSEINSSDMTPFNKALSSHVIMNAAKQTGPKVGYNDLVRGAVNAGIGYLLGRGVAKTLDKMFSVTVPRAGTIGAGLGAARSFNIIG